jgi:hypothetical protein
VHFSCKVFHAQALAWFQGVRPDSAQNVSIRHVCKGGFAIPYIFDLYQVPSHLPFDNLIAVNNVDV